MCKYILIHKNVPITWLVLYAQILAEIVAVPSSNFGKIHIVILTTIQVNTEIIKYYEIEH